MVLIVASTTQAATTYTVSDVVKHSTTGDCWMIFENKVYNVTPYVLQHDSQIYDISSWCGKDMTVAFQTKDGSGRDHRSSTYSLLQSLYIGDLSTTSAPVVQPKSSVQTTPTNQFIPTPTTSTTIPVVQNSTATQKSQNPYNVTFPVIFIITLYFLGYYISGSGIGKNYSVLSRLAFNSFWNSILLISMIPSLLFGLFLILEYQFPSLRNLSFNFLYWHVEGGIVFGTVALLHFWQRYRQYLAQIRTFKSQTNTVAKENKIV